MLGDVLLINDKHKYAAAKISEYILQHRKERMITAI